LVRAVVLAAVGIVLVLDDPPALHGQPDHEWIGKRVMPRSPIFLLRIENQVLPILPRTFDIYRVEQVNGPWLRLRAEREGSSGWALSEQVVPVNQAIEFFTDYIRAKPDDSYGYAIRAIIRERERKELDLALGDYNEAIRLDPTKAYGYNNRGRLWSAKKEYDKAIADYTEAIRLDPKDAVARNNRGGAWLAKKEYDKAIADYTEAQRLDPTYASADFNRIYLLFATRRDGVVEGTKRFLEIRGWRGYHSTHVVIMGHLAALRSGQTSQARTFLDEAAARCDTSTWPYPVVKYLRGEIDEAKLLAAATDNEKMTEARCYLGLKMIQQQQKEAALAYLHWVAEHGDPSFLENTVALAEIDRLTGR
jgi:lipoprotein NlpI